MNACAGDGVVLDQHGLGEGAAAGGRRGDLDGVLRHVEDGVAGNVDELAGRGIVDQQDALAVGLAAVDAVAGDDRPFHVGAEDAVGERAGQVEAGDPVLAARRHDDEVAAAVVADQRRTAAGE